MRITALYTLIPELKDQPLEAQIRTVLPLDLYKTVTQSMNRQTYFDKAFSENAFTKKPLSAQPQSSFEGLSIEFMKELYTLLESSELGYTIHSLWASDPFFREAMEVILQKPCAWIQWDWMQRWDHWNLLNRPQAMSSSQEKVKIQKSGGASSVIILGDQSAPEPAIAGSTEVTRPDIMVASPPVAMTPPPPPPPPKMKTTQSTQPDTQLRRIPQHTLEILAKQFKKPGSTTDSTTVPTSTSNVQLRTLGGNSPTASPSISPAPSAPSVAATTTPMPQTVPATPKPSVGDLRKPLLDPPLQSHETSQKILQLLSHETTMEGFANTTLKFLQGTFSSGGLFLVQDHTIAGWCGFGHFSDLKTMESFQMDCSAPSIFKIVLTSLHPYHGFVVQNEIHKQFFSAFAMSEPENMTVLPCSQKGEIFLLLVGLCSQGRARKVDVYEIHDDAQLIGSLFLKLSKNSSAA